MKIIFFVLQYIFATNTGVISSSLWDGKVDGPKPIHFYKLQSGVYIVKRVGFGRVCVATAVSESVLVTSGRFIKTYKGLLNNGGLYVQIGTKEVSIKCMEYYDKYSDSKQHEFDVGIIKIENFQIPWWLVPEINVSPSINKDDTLELITYVGRRRGPCIMAVRSMEICFEEMKITRQDDPLFVTVVNETNAIMQDVDYGAPVFKGKELVGIVSYYLKQSEEVIIVCTSVLRSEVFTFITKALKEVSETFSKRRRTDQK